MSPDAQHLERFFKPGSGTQPPIDAARYQEELKDFTSFFEKLSSLDTMDWFASDESTPAPKPAVERAPEPEREQPHAKVAQSQPADAPAAQAAGTEDEAEEAQPEIPDGMKMLERVLDVEADAAQERAARVTPLPIPRMHVYHSTQAPDLDEQPGFVGFDARSMVSGERHGGGMRGFLGRMQLVLLIAFGASLLFAMGLGMGALVLSLPREAAFGDHPSLVTEEVTDPAAQPERTADGKETIGEVSLPAYPAGGDAKQAAAVKAQAAAPAAKPAGKIAAKPAQPVAAVAPKPAASATAVAPEAKLLAPAVTTNTAPVQNAVPTAPVAAAPVAVAPAAAQPVAEGTFALQVGACSAYTCVEQFRNLLLAEVESNRIKVITAGEGAQAIHRVRIEPLSRESAEQLKETLAAKDARLAKAYLVTLH